MQAIQSAGSGVLTSPGLAAFKQTLKQAQTQHAIVNEELSTARVKEAEAVGKYETWSNGWILKRLFRKRFAALRAASDMSTEMRRELEEQLAQSRLETQFDLPDGVARAFARMSDDFESLTRAQRIWDNVAQRAANQFAERTIAGRIIDLKPVRFKLAKCSIIDTPISVPHLQNANGGDIYFYPGFLVYLVSESNFALIECADVSLVVTPTRFEERSAPAGDATQVGTTWAKCNKDGSPDKRFKGNFQIPIMQYATLKLETTSGLNEEYLISNVAMSEAFARSWSALVQAVEVGQ